MTFRSLVAAFSHPLTRRARRAVRLAVTICAVILAAAIVTSATVDLGPALKGQAEAQGSKFIQRPMHIGRLAIHLWRGQFVVEDFVIEGLTPHSRPFLTAKRIAISMPWSSLFHRRVVFDAIEMTDWRMYVELMADGRHNFPKFTRERSGPKSAWTTTLQYVRASRGECTYEDHGTPWSIVANNLDVTVARPASEYRGQASFSDGRIAMQQFVPFRTDMRSWFKIEDGQVKFDRIDLSSEGAQTRLTGAVDLGHWPEQRYQLTSTIDFATQKAIWFGDDDFTASGTGTFDGTFHLFKEHLPDGRSRVGRELKGTFASGLAGVNSLRFPNLQGSVLWTPALLDITNARASLYGGRAAFSYRMAPLDQHGVRSTQTFDARYEGVDLAAFTTAMELQGLRLAGRASGRNLLQWPTGQFADHRGEGTIAVGSDQPLLTTGGLAAAAAIAPPVSAGSRAPFSPHTPRDPVPIAGELRYTLSREWVDVEPGWIATPTTYVDLGGRTAYGDRSNVWFHATSSDWQESDRVFAGMLTAFGSRTSAIQVAGYGTFDGVLYGAFSRPRIEGRFAGEQMVAWDVDWGSIRGEAVIENSYADVRNGVIRRGDSEMIADGRFSLGYPRRDGGEEFDARIQVRDRPLADLRHAFDLDAYPITGTLSGEFHVYGHYERPLGYGTMTIAHGTAYGETFDLAQSQLRFEGNGVRLDTISLDKGAGRGTGAAFVGWDGTYSFNVDVRNVPVEGLALLSHSPLPLSGLLDFTASGSGNFEVPRYTVHATVRDLFAADEGIGQVVGDIAVDDLLLRLKVEVASPRLAVSGAGQVRLNDAMDADLSFTVNDSSLDPYIRAFEPALSPYTTAVVSGAIRVTGALANPDRLLVDARVDRLDLRLFDYALHNAAPIQLALDHREIQVTDMRLVGEGTQLDIEGRVGLGDERIDMRATGDANLGILQGFVPDVRSAGRATLEARVEGSLRDPAVSGGVHIANGRIRFFAFPHALEDITGDLRFDSRGVSLDGLTAKLGGGAVRFGGRVDKRGYQVGRIDVTIEGEGMRLRFPEGMRSVVDASLALQGTPEAMTIGGDVYVRNAVYSQALEPGGFLELTGRGSGAAAGAPPEEPLPLRYDIRIHAPGTLQVRNTWARFTVSADLQLRGTYARPLLFGRADVDRGDVLFEGKRYLVTHGSIDFNNPTRIQPFIDVEAETRVRVPRETYRVTIRATGTLDRLTTDFSSDPPLSPAEVLALLFSDTSPGQDVELRQYRTDITSQQELARERATRALTGALSSEVGRVVEQTFGVDTFQVTPSLVDPNTQSSRLDPTARVTIGKRLSDRIYLTYSRSLSSSSSDQIILLEYDQSDRLSWILSRNEDRTYALDVRVRHTF